MSTNRDLQHPHDEDWMQEALALARVAGENGEVPVGAVVVENGMVIGRGRNQPITAVDPTAHAEIAALRDAAETRGNYRLPAATLYTTLEPCAMCAGAIIQARLARVVFGACDERAGAVQSVFSILTEPSLNHRVVVTDGVEGESSASLLRHFFRARRNASAACGGTSEPASLISEEST